ncbi:hypothetical protein NR798_15010 [Archangium gephyra]|uniref:Tc toxin subunit A-related protein n=1 Tax=Archangium gephyra TaxID=48 RepID=UPI0035D47863
MAGILHAENYYAFRQLELVVDFDRAPRSATSAELAEIEAALVRANQQFIARHYQDAIASYRFAERLIHSHLDSAAPVWVPRAGFEVSRARELFDPLLSASLEWMNALPVHEPSLIQPRLPVDRRQLGDAAALDGSGLRSASVVRPESAQAVADFQLAKAFEADGHAATARFFADRARRADPDLVSRLQPAPTPPPEPTPLPRPPVGRVPGLGLRVDAGLAVTRAGLDATSLLRSVSLVERPVALPPALTETRTVGLFAQQRVTNISWAAGVSPPLQDVRSLLYEKRVQLSDLISVSWLPTHAADVAAHLPHSYYYVIPLGLAECYHALGDYPNAERFYLQAASYPFLNAPIEAPYLWLRLATLYLDWGDARYRAEEASDALNLYQNVLMANGAAPTAGSLYTSPALAPGATAARKVLANLQQLIAGQTTAEALDVNPALAGVLVEVHQRLLLLAAGLDFWGYPLTTVPIWTFDYLQSVAINFAQLAISVERDVINFWDRADQAALTRQQIAQSVAQGQAEVQAAAAQVAAADAEVTVYQDGLVLAQQRAANARANASNYASLSAQWIVLQAASSQINGGDNSNTGSLNALADRVQAGHASGSHATLGAAVQLAASRLNREYEVKALQRQAQEMGLAANQAQAELAAARARNSAARAAKAVAQLRATHAAQNLAAFDAQTFTPDVWHQMGDAMWRLYQRYFRMALRTARLMQQAYNFETDQSLHLIKGDYSGNEVRGLLGADLLMADIQSFTYDLITQTAGKPQPIRQTLSLAQRYPFAFENQLRTTGAMDFETRIEDFDSLYPGTYAGRLEAVEVEVDGIVPVTGLSGTLTNAGISAYRTPSSVVMDPASRGLKFRIQPKETLVLSDYSARQDALLVTPDTRMRRVMQGAGLVSTWRLEFPKEVNDLDYGALTDVRITFYYKARFDPGLVAKVRAELAALPAVNERQRGLPLRWIYPDAFFHFQDTGTLRLTLEKQDFAFNETNPVLTHIGLVVATDGSVPRSGITFSLATPGHAAVSAVTGADGFINSEGSSPWAPLASGTALGDYVLQVTAEDNPALVQDGKLKLDGLVNVALLLGYRFTPRG